MPRRRTTPAQHERPLGARHGGSALFTVIVSVLLLLGAGVMCLVLVLANAPGALAVGVVLAALPVGPVIAAFLWLDRDEPEPARFLVLAFFWGAVVATSAALVLQSIDQIVLGTPDNWSAAIVAPVTEEGGQGAVRPDAAVVPAPGHRRGPRRDRLRGHRRGRASRSPRTSSTWPGLHGQRGAGHGRPRLGDRPVRRTRHLQPLRAPLFTSFIGLGVGFAVVAKQRKWRVLAPLPGYLAAVTAHATWNASAFFGGGGTFVLTYACAMVPAFLLLAGFAAWSRTARQRC